MTRARLVFVVICALAIGLAAGYLLGSAGSPSIEERARGSVEWLRGAIERATR